MPPANDPVSVCTLPTTYGPRKPPRFPTELMRPMLPAAAALERKMFGSAQNVGHLLPPRPPEPPDRVIKAERTVNGLTEVALTAYIAETRQEGNKLHLRCEGPEGLLVGIPFPFEPPGMQMTMPWSMIGESL